MFKKKYAIIILILFIIINVSRETFANNENSWYCIANNNQDVSQGIYWSNNYTFSPFNSVDGNAYRLYSPVSLQYVFMKFSNSSRFGATYTHYRVKYRIDNTSPNQTIQFGYSSDWWNNGSSTFPISRTVGLNVSNGYAMNSVSYDNSYIVCIVQGAKLVDDYGYVVIDLFSTANDYNVFLNFGVINNKSCEVSVETVSVSNYANVYSEILDYLKSIDNSLDISTSDIESANQENVEEIIEYDNNASNNIIIGSDNLYNNQNNINNNINDSINNIDNVIKEYPTISLTDDTGLFKSISDYLLNNDLFIAILGTLLILVVIDIVVIRS